MFWQPIPPARLDRAFSPLPPSLSEVGFAGGGADKGTPFQVISNGMGLPTLPLAGITVMRTPGCLERGSDPNCSVN